MKGSKLTDWSQPLPGYDEEGSYCDAAAVPIGPQPKSQPLELCQLGGAGTLIVLNACPSDIRRNLAPWKSDLCQNCYLQCTFMADVVIGLHKKSPEHGESAFRIFLCFTIKPMSGEQELQDLLREF